MREKLDDMSDLVKQNLLKEQSCQKSWYDRNARLREFKEGDPVLVLLPTSTQKLLAQWQGPYQVVKQTGRVTYLIDMHDRRKRRRIFHVNMLKAFQVRQQDNNCYVEEDIEETEIPVWNDNPPGESTIGQQLTEPQKQELGKLLTKYRNVFSNKPGRTNLVTHHIKTGDVGPIRLPPYRLPYAYREQVVKELAEMLENGIIEELSSGWALPIVLVPKKDKSLRLCVDYRRLNAVSKVEAYPMPRIDELIDQLGRAKCVYPRLTSQGVIGKCRWPRRTDPKQPL